VANKKVTLIRICKTATGWKRYPAAVGVNGKIRPGYAVVDGEQVHFPEGHYALRTYEGSRMVYTSLGDKNATDALAAQKVALSKISGVVSAPAAVATLIVDGKVASKTLSQKKVEFVKRLIAKGHQRASETAEQAIDDFLDATYLTQTEQVNEAAVLKFYRALRTRGNSDRTVYNKHVSLFGFFKWLGLDVKKLAERPPSYTEREVEVYEPEDLNTLLASCISIRRQCSRPC
jgi:hypothetical protein